MYRMFYNLQKLPDHINGRLWIVLLTCFRNQVRFNW